MKKTVLISGVLCASIALSLPLIAVNKSDIVPEKTAHASKLEQGNTVKSKSEIQTLMLNAIDHYQSAEGTFEYMSKAGDFHLLVDYQVDLSESPKSYEKLQGIKSKNSQGALTTEDGYAVTVYDGKSLIGYNSGSADYKTNGVTKDTKPTTFEAAIDKMSDEERYEMKGSTMNERLITDENGESLAIHKADPANMGIAKASLLPEDIALGLLANEKDWDIAGQEEVSGVQTMVIKGQLNNYYAGKWGAESFKLNVEPKTGILLTMEAYDSAGKITDLIKTHSIQINKGTNEKLFTDFIE